ncbi:MAG TPA: hypothetical protein VFN49_06615 [Candidatus Aquilonibacter sp.]|nr:hypothetical protein [Candidatus Aquilonibacter sp.]
MTDDFLQVESSANVLLDFGKTCEGYKWYRLLGEVAFEPSAGFCEALVGFDCRREI